MSNSLLLEELRNPEVRLAFEQDWLHQEFVTQLEHYMHHAQILRKTLAEKMDKSPSYITKAMRQGHNLTINTMAHMALAVGMRINIRLTKIVGDELPTSMFDDVVSMNEWQRSEVKRRKPVNDNCRSPDPWNEAYANCADTLALDAA